METTQPDYFAKEDSDRARPPTTSGQGRLPKQDPRDHTATGACSRPAANSQPSITTNSFAMVRGPRAGLVGLKPLHSSRTSSLPDEGTFHTLLATNRHETLQNSHKV